MNRRGFLRGLAALVAAPAVVRAASLMPVVSLCDAAKMERLLREGREICRGDWLISRGIVVPSHSVIRDCRIAASSNFSDSSMLRMVGQKFSISRVQLIGANACDIVRA